MEELKDALRKVRKKFRKEIEAKLKEFRRKRSREEIFQELAFCLLVANSRLEKTLQVVEELKEEILTLSESELRRKLRDLGYRFWRKRASYLVEARRKLDHVVKVVSKRSSEEARKWLVGNVKGLGYKEASHFLRNLGARDVAILDRHVMRTLKSYEITNYERTPPKSEYLRIERELRAIARELEMNLTELDLCIFLLATGRIPER